jgi:hypothetical protein
MTTPLPDSKPPHSQSAQTNRPTQTRAHKTALPFRTAYNSEPTDAKSQRPTRAAGDPRRTFFRRARTPEGLLVIVGCQRLAYGAFIVSAATIVSGTLLGASPAKLAAVGATSLIFLLIGTFLWSWGFAITYDLYTDDEDHDGGGQGGQPGGPPELPPGPTIDWDRFEADFQAWARTRELIHA